MQPMLLCVGLEPNQLMRVSLIASSLGISVKAVRQDEQGQTIGALCGLDTPSQRPAKNPSCGAMLVMAFFEETMMDQLMMDLRANGQFIRLKAVLTPTNRHWTCAELYRQLALEAAQMQR